MLFPKISIVTPTYNRADYLEETILSVLNQNYPNLEYIIIDGGSTDGTIDIIKKYESYLTFWISEPDNGMYHAIQKGFEKSGGDIMAWLNSDDKYHPGSLKIVAEIFSTLNEVDWITGTPSLYNEDGNCVKVFQNLRWSKSRVWVGDYRWIQQESVFWRRSLWEKAGNALNLSFKYASDFELWCRFFQNAKLFSVGAVLSGFRLHGNQLTTLRNIAYEEEVKVILKCVRSQTFISARLILLKCFYAVKNILIHINLKMTNFIASVISLLMDKLNCYPPLVYYDFDKKKWSI
jgi:glycosyltransferase involved in cell wall biosynthesis